MLPRGLAAYDFGETVGAAVASDEADGAAVPAGSTPAPESGAEEEAGELRTGEVAGDDPGDDCDTAGAGEVCAG